jgi:hypothetical protein
LVNGRTEVVGYDGRPEEAAVPTAVVGAGVTVITLVITVGTQVEMVWVLRTGAGLETG